MVRAAWTYARRWFSRCRCRSYYRRTGEHVEDCPRGIPARPGNLTLAAIITAVLAYVHHYRCREESMTPSLPEILQERPDAAKTAP